MLLSQLPRSQKWQRQVPEPIWIEDGHKLHFRIDQAEVGVFYVECPFEGLQARCNKGRENCVIDTFVAIYGTELNIGEAFIYGPLEIAWTPVLGQSDIDDEFAQVWIIPLADQSYKAFKLLNGIDIEE